MMNGETEAHSYKVSKDAVIWNQGYQFGLSSIVTWNQGVLAESTGFSSTLQIISKLHVSRPALLEFPPLNSFYHRVH